MSRALSYSDAHRRAGGHCWRRGSVRLMTGGGVLLFQGMEVNVKAPQAVPVVTDTRAAQPIFLLSYCCESV